MFPCLPKGGRRDLEEKPTNLKLYWLNRRGEEMKIMGYPQGGVGSIKSN
jgi:hypothetical protein